MTRTKQLSLIVALSVLALQACGTGVSQADLEETIAAGIAQTQTMKSGMELGVEATLTALGKGGAQETPLAGTGTLTPTVAIGTAEIVTVSVSTDTWCNKGPGSIYGHEFLFYVGQTAEVIGKDEYGDYWVIKKPDNPAVTCWLWGKYATITGDPSTLPVIPTPPTPTPPPGMVTGVSITDQIQVIHTPFCDSFEQEWFVNISTDGPATVNYYTGYPAVNDYDYGTMIFTSAGTQKQYHHWLTSGMGACGTKTIIAKTTSPNVMSAQVSFTVSH